MSTMLAVPRRPLEKTKPISLRFDKALLKELIEFADAQEFTPTLTQLLESAVREFLDKRRSRPTPRPK